MAIQPLITIQGQWVDLYDVTEITVGTELIIQNFISDAPVAISDSATEPTESTGRVRVNESEFFTVTNGSAGAWAYCSGLAQVSIQEGA